MERTVADALQELGRRGWSVTGVARELGVARQTVSKWWNGQDMRGATGMVLLALAELGRREAPSPLRRGPKPKGTEGVK